MNVVLNAVMRMTGESEVKRMLCELLSGAWPRDADSQAHVSVDSRRRLLHGARPVHSPVDRLPWYSQAPGPRSGH